MIFKKITTQNMYTRRLLVNLIIGIFLELTTFDLVMRKVTFLNICIKKITSKMFVLYEFQFN